MSFPAREAARNRYVLEHSYFESAAEIAGSILSNLCRDIGISGAQVRVRAKQVGSFVKKLHKYGDDCWDRVTDKVGAQITTRTLRDVVTLRKALEAGTAGLAHLSTVDKALEASPRMLYYQGIHVQVLILEASTSAGEPIECEIQLRTQAQDVWASLEHSVVYKPVIGPSRAIERRIERLSVLVEIFDEEVDAVMNETAADDRYANALLLRAAESLYHEFIAEAGDSDLSREVLELVATSIGTEERTDYPHTLSSFVVSHRDKLTRIFADFGIATSFAQDFAFFLFSQPESLIVFERLSTRPAALADAIAGSDVVGPVKRLAAAWGRPLPAVGT